MTDTSRRDVLKWATAGGLLLLFAAFLFEVAGSRKLERTRLILPELGAVDEALERSLRTAWPSGVGGHERDEAAAEFASVARAGGADSARAILRILVETYHKESGGIDSYGPFFDDEKHELAGWLLGELADEKTREVMLRLLPERDYHAAFRRALAVAICRPETAIAPLIERVLDRQEDNVFRKRLLVRLPRLEASPPKELRDLLYQPFGGLDRCAAATLARMGDPEAPSLVLDAFDWVGWDDGDLYHLVRATERITGETIAFSKNPQIPGTGREVLDRFHERRAARHKKVLATWLEDREPDTEFERGYREYKASERRRREMSLRTFEDVRKAGDDFDLAAASLLLTGYRTDSLGSLDRFARLLRRKLEGVTEPEEIVAVLNRWIQKRDHSTEALVYRSGRLSFLPLVFSQDAGNCLGYSTLYLALAERLDLSLHGALVPGHSFVRYDDGNVRRNIETTALGVEQADEDYGAGPIASKNRSKREMLSAILSNEAATCRFYSDFEGALVACKRALQLDPTNAAAAANYAAALYETQLRGREELLDAFGELRRLVPEAAEPLLLIAQVHMDFEEDERALEVLEEAARIEPSPRSRAMRARCLARLERFDEANQAIEGAADDPLLRTVRLEIHIRRQPENAERLVEEATQKPEERMAVATEAARVLVEIREAAAALAVLDQAAEEANRSYKQDWLTTKGGISLDPRSWSGKRQRYFLVKAKALHAAGQQGAANAAFAKARELGGSSRLMLEVRDLLR
jgi:regulator of sirC expression with transglutaminase-like and TPR domain